MVNTGSIWGRSSDIELAIEFNRSAITKLDMTNIITIPIRRKRTVKIKSFKVFKLEGSFFGCWIGCSGIFWAGTAAFRAWSKQ